MTFVIYRYNLKVMGIFSKDEPITKEYLESSGFELTVKQFGVVYKLKIVASYGYMGHRCYYYYFPKSQCDIEGILQETSMLEVNYYDDETGKTINKIIELEVPKTQFDLDTLVLQCVDIIRSKCKNTVKIFTKAIKQ